VLICRGALVGPVVIPVAGRSARWWWSCPATGNNPRGRLGDLTMVYQYCPEAVMMPVPWLFRMVESSACPPPRCLVCPDWRKAGHGPCSGRRFARSRCRRSLWSGLV